MPVMQVDTKLIWHIAPPQPELIEFLKSLPTVMGFGIEQDFLELHDFLSAMVDNDFLLLPLYVEIDAIGLLAGYAS